MSNNNLNSLQTQLTFNFMLNFNVELTYEEQALITLFEGLDYSGFGTDKGRPERFEAYKMMILLVHGAVNGRTSCRALEQHVDRDLFMKAVFGPDVKVDHSTISRFIKKYPAQIEDVFRQSVEKLASLGELTMETVFQDSTKIESRAGRYTFVWKSYTETNRGKCISRIMALIERARAQGLVTTENDKQPGDCVEVLKGVVDTIDSEGLFNPEVRGGRGHRRNEINDIRSKAEEELGKIADYDSYLKTIGTSRKSMSKTDKDATFMRMKEDHMRNGQLKPAYNIQNAVDANYVVASSISSDRTDYRTAPSILGKLDSLPWRYANFCADSGYDSMDSYCALESRGITAYIKPQDWEISKTRSYRNDIGRSVNMEYVEKEDCFICANGKKLVLTGERRRKGSSEMTRTYSCRRGCVSCPYRGRCIRNPKRNRFKSFEVRLEHQRRQRQAYERLSTDFGAEVRANRSIQVEGRFAMLKQQFGMRRFKSFGMERVFTE